MSREIITARDIEIVTAEIVTIKDQTRRMIVANAVEIGRRLTEAKSMVPHGEWGKYLKERVDYSQSTAENLMRLFREYGDNQESLFDSFTKSEAFGSLTYTKALALLAIPSDERQEFADKHDLENMSTRELEKAIRERDLAVKRGQEMEAQVAALEDSLREAKSATGQAQNALATASEENEELARRASAAEDKVAQAAAQVSDLQTELASVKARAEKAEKAAASQEVPAEIMEQLRRDADAEAAEKVAKEVERRLIAATDAQRKAETELEEIRSQLESARKSGKSADADTQSIKALAQQIEMTWNVIKGHRKKIAEQDPQKSENVQRFLRALLEKLGKDI